MIINAINAQIALGIDDGSLPQTPNASRLDVNDDGLLSAIDALIIINRLNELSSTIVPRPIVTTPPVISIPRVSSSAPAEGEATGALTDQALLELQIGDCWLDLGVPRSKTQKPSRE
jgi:hypothetical protein